MEKEKEDESSKSSVIINSDDYGHLSDGSLYEKTRRSGGESSPESIYSLLGTTPIVVADPFFSSHHHSLTKNKGDENKIHNISPSNPLFTMLPSFSNFNNNDKEKEKEKMEPPPLKSVQRRNSVPAPSFSSSPTSTGKRIEKNNKDEKGIFPKGDFYLPQPFVLQGSVKNDHLETENNTSTLVSEKNTPSTSPITSPEPGSTLAVGAGMSFSQLSKEKRAKAGSLSPPHAQSLPMHQQNHIKNAKKTSSFPEPMLAGSAGPISGNHANNNNNPTNISPHSILSGQSLSGISAVSPSHSHSSHPISVQSSHPVSVLVHSYPNHLYPNTFKLEHTHSAPRLDSQKGSAVTKEHQNSNDLKRAKSQLVPPSSSLSSHQEDKRKMASLSEISPQKEGEKMKRLHKNSSSGGSVGDSLTFVSSSSRSSVVAKRKSYHSHHGSQTFEPPPPPQPQNNLKKNEKQKKKTKFDLDSSFSQKSENKEDDDAEKSDAQGQVLDEILKNSGIPFSNAVDFLESDKPRDEKTNSYSTQSSSFSRARPLKKHGRRQKKKQHQHKRKIQEDSTTSEESYDRRPHKNRPPKRMVENTDQRKKKRGGKNHEKKAETFFQQNHDSDENGNDFLQDPSQRNGYDLDFYDNNNQDGGGGGGGGGGQQQEEQEVFMEQMSQGESLNQMYDVESLNDFLHEALFESRAREKVHLKEFKTLRAKNGFWMAVASLFGAINTIGSVSSIYNCTSPVWLGYVLAFSSIAIAFSGYILQSKEFKSRMKLHEIACKNYKEFSQKLEMKLMLKKMKVSDLERVVERQNKLSNESPVITVTPKDKEREKDLFYGVPSTSSTSSSVSSIPVEESSSSSVAHLEMHQQQQLYLQQQQQQQQLYLQQQLEQQQFLQQQMNQQLQIQQMLEALMQSQNHSAQEQEKRDEKDEQRYFLHPMYYKESLSDLNKEEKKETKEENEKEEKEEKKYSVLNVPRPFLYNDKEKKEQEEGKIDRDPSKLSLGRNIMMTNHEYTTVPDDFNMIHTVHTVVDSQDSKTSDKPALPPLVTVQIRRQKEKEKEEKEDHLSHIVTIVEEEEEHNKNKKEDDQKEEMMGLPTLKRSKQISDTNLAISPQATRHQSVEEWVKTVPVSPIFKPGLEKENKKEKEKEKKHNLLTLPPASFDGETRASSSHNTTSHTSSSSSSFKRNSSTLKSSSKPPKSPMPFFENNNQGQMYLSHKSPKPVTSKTSEAFMTTGASSNIYFSEPGSSPGTRRRSPTPNTPPSAKRHQQEMIGPAGPQGQKADSPPMSMYQIAQQQMQQLLQQQQLQQQQMQQQLLQQQQQIKQPLTLFPQNLSQMQGPQGQQMVQVQQGPQVPQVPQMVQMPQVPQVQVSQGQQQGGMYGGGRRASTPEVRRLSPPGMRVFSNYEKSSGSKSKKNLTEGVDFAGPNNNNVVGPSVIQKMNNFRNMKPGNLSVKTIVPTNGGSGQGDFGNEMFYQQGPGQGPAQGPAQGPGQGPFQGQNGGVTPKKNESTRSLTKMVRDSQKETGDYGLSGSMGNNNNINNNMNNNNFEMEKKRMSLRKQSVDQLPFFNLQQQQQQQLQQPISGRMTTKYSQQQKNGKRSDSSVSDNSLRSF